MKTGIIKTAILLAVGISLSACGDESNSKTKVQGQGELKPQSGTELTGEPGTAEEMANQTYRLKGEHQEFVLKNLGHLVWAKFECKAESLDDKNTSTLIVSFYPTFEIKNKSEEKEKVVVSPSEVCGRNLTTEVLTGQLSKNENNQYHLQYGLSDTDTPLVTMAWDANNAVPGEISCTNL